jgi:RNA polymerase primary sigma factor
MLAEQSKNGDHQALRELVEAHLSFVVKIAKQFQGYGLSLEDLIDEGNRGLVEATKCFNSSKGLNFRSYAFWWVRHTIMMALVKQSQGQEWSGGLGSGGGGYHG